MIAYETNALTKRYPGSILANDNVDLRVPEGEVFGLLGSNGAGKTTLVRQLVNLLQPTSGWIKLFGRRIDDDPLAVSLNVGYMPQDGRALGSVSVGRALHSTARFRGMSRKEARADKELLLELWDLGPCRDQPISRISRGQRRLTSLATAMAGRPPVLILDEPSNDLDPERRHTMWNQLRSLQAEAGTTIILVTHDLVEAERVIDSLAIMRAGRLLTVGRPHALKKRLDQRLRMELHFPPDHPPTIPAGILPQEAGVGRWVLRLTRSQVPEVLRRIDLTQIDVKVYSATLEDLYLHYATA